MQVIAAYADRILGRDPVNPLFPRELGRGKLFMVPIAFQYPLAFPKSLGFLFDSFYELLSAGHIPELDAGKGKTALQEMGVTIDETGKDKSPIQVNDLGLFARELLDFGRPADPRNPVSVDGHTLRPRLGWVDSPDRPVYKD
jgi:hypothetical protein